LKSACKKKSDAGASSPFPSTLEKMHVAKRSGLYWHACKKGILFFSLLFSKEEESFFANEVVSQLSFFFGNPNIYNSR
jgi:hypothetical protein